MPLTELMNYFNDQLQTQARLHELPKTGFYKADNQYWARFGNLILGSQFAEIFAANREQLVGHYADLFVRSSAGNILNIDDIVNALEDTQQVIHLDRLARTLHSLNYLQQFDGFKGLLTLRVQARHILSVANEHGKTFEKILSDCGLGPERVVLYTRLLSAADLPHFQQALTSYRQRQYLIGISVHDLAEWELLQEFAITPDYIFVSEALLTRLRELPRFALSTVPKLIVGNADQYTITSLAHDNLSDYSVVNIPQRLAS